jgi:hypothetical protein
MSKENLFFRAWKNKGAIMEGIKNNVFKKEHIEEMYNHRLNICKGCDSMDEKGDSCAIPNTAPCCAECGCSFSIKLRSASAACDLGKWGPEMSQEEEDELEEQLNK